jgi:exodeoxyribonuclease V alpha subunit
MFGDALTEVLDRADRKSLRTVVSDQKVEVLLAAWGERREQQVLAQWLTDRAIDSTIAQHIYDIWGSDAIDKLTLNPYRLMAFCSWKTAETLAKKLGVSGSAPARLVAAVEHCAHQALDRGDTVFTPTELRRALLSLLSRIQAAPDPISDLVNHAISLASETGALIKKGENYQIPGAYFAERDIESWINTRQRNYDGSVWDQKSWFDDDREKLETSLTAEQSRAVITALTAPISAIVGGAGVGKTHTLKALCDASEKMFGKSPVLLALAAKAARRMAQATGRPAMTMASCIYRNNAKELSGKIIVIDEFSMVDLLSFRSLLSKLDDSNQVVVVGDLAQLPSIGAGNLLQDLVRSQVIPVSHLTQVLRQTSDSGIPAILDSVREGIWPHLADFDWTAPEKPGVTLIQASEHQIPRLCQKLHSAFNGDLQILSPLVKGKLGTNALNRSLHHSIFGTDEWLPGTSVVFTKNQTLSSGVRILNGLTGQVAQKLIKHTRSKLVPWLLIDTELGAITVTLDEAENYLELAWGLSVHKAQGSAWNTVVVVLPPHLFLMERSMIYTALSRCKERCICLVPDIDALQKAVSGAPAFEFRRTGLFEQAACVSPRTD